MAKTIYKKIYLFINYETLKQNDFQKL